MINKLNNNLTIMNKGFKSRHFGVCGFIFFYFYREKGTWRKLVREQLTSAVILTPTYLKTNVIVFCMYEQKQLWSSNGYQGIRISIFNSYNWSLHLLTTRIFGDRMIIIRCLFYFLSTSIRSQKKSMKYSTND